MKKVIRVLLVDDHEVVRHVLRRMLEPEDDIEVVGDCASAEETFSQLGTLSPNVVLMDVQMPGMNGIEATRSLKRSGLHYDGDVIMLADFVNYRVEALEAGAASYLLKDVKSAELVQLIRQVYRNGHPLEKRDGLVEGVVELVVPPPANAAWLLRFMCQLEERLNDNFAIICTVGSWSRGTVVRILPQRTTPSSLLDELANIPEVEKVEETGEDSFQKHNQRMRAFRLSHPKKTMRVTLKEPDMTGQELATVLK